MAPRPSTALRTACRRLPLSTASLVAAPASGRLIAIAIVVIVVITLIVGVPRFRLSALWGGCSSESRLLGIAPCSSSWCRVDCPRYAEMASALSEWSCDDVINWLNATLRLPQYEAAFRGDEIDGAILVSGCEPAIPTAQSIKATRPPSGAMLRIRRICNGVCCHGHSSARTCCFCGRRLCLG